MAPRQTLESLKMSRFESSLYVVFFQHHQHQTKHLQRYIHVPSSQVSSSRYPHYLISNDKVTGCAVVLLGFTAIFIYVQENMLFQLFSL